MALLDRLSGKEEPKLPVHQFQASLYEWQLGGMTRADVISLFSIAPDEEAELDFLKTRYGVAATNGKEVEFSRVVDSVLLLAEQDLFYDTQAKVQARLTAASGP